MTILLPCPFCGSQDVITFQDEWNCAEVECNVCLCHGPTVSRPRGMDDEDHKELARIEWNKRTVQ